MKIAGRRTDGALYLSIGAGHAVILRGDRVSAPHDESEIERMGPWTWSPDDNTFEARQTAQRRANLAKVVSLATLTKESTIRLDGKPPVSEIAQTAQAGEAAAPAPTEEVMNLPPAPDPAEERRKKRGELKDKLRGAARSQKRVADVLDDEDISDDDLYAMAKSLGVTTDEHPGAVTLVDNATKYQHLLSSTTAAKHLADAGEHPFQYCLDTVVPSMEAEGKGPDDPNAFCAYWAKEHGGR